MRWLAALALLPLVAACELPRITGQVYDVHGEELPGVAVSIEGTPHQAVTNAHGEYTLPLKEGALTLTFIKSGYTPGALSLPVPEPAEIVAADVQLWPLPRDAGVYFMENFEYRPLDTISAERMTVVEPLLGVVYGTRRKEAVQTDDPTPFIVGYRVPSSALRLSRLLPLDLKVESGQEAVEPVTAWVPNKALPVQAVRIDKHKGLLRHFRLSAPLEPGRYAIDWGALEGMGEQENRVFMFDVAAPPAESPAAEGREPASEEAGTT